jgi:Family of unknown function (DUF6163)
MTVRDKNAGPDQERATRLPLMIEVYARALAVVMMVLGLRQWAIILGVIGGKGGMFEAMSTPWQLATMHLAVVDLVASVGLWMRAAWGNVLWIYAALSEIALHTVLAGAFRSNALIVAFHLVTIAGFIALQFLARRNAAK